VLVLEDCKPLSRWHRTGIQLRSWNRPSPSKRYGLQNTLVFDGLTKRVPLRSSNCHSDKSAQRVALHGALSCRFNIYLHRRILFGIADVPILGRRRYPRSTQQLSLWESMGCGLQ